MTTNEIIRCSRIVGMNCIRRYIAVFYSCEFKSLYIQLSELSYDGSLGLMYRDYDSDILFYILR
ncbi:hypothetical protein EST35_0110 [Pseudomonas phage vB_PaeM_PA5oct]|uniref:Uncharacterized protein n=1 Tax=Pseudomonas phage vB_PaeM_PA5oct TaxID=2163605 RepID=A0A4Y5JV64_9CAUD|nr:hypothetical protein PQE65_gp373 [Pseudomonas phage vB_PaeM_PA5oct]QCG75992.1 hypothetical protein EST35_0110 [Pseudomonas phage vB_PaeM_PA5oct]